MKKESLLAPLAHKAINQNNAVTYEKIQRDQEDLEGKEERGTHGETVFVFCLAFVVVVVVVVSCNLWALLLKQRVSLVASCQYNTLVYYNTQGTRSSMYQSTSK